MGGPWVQKKVANPNYKEDPELYRYEDFGFIGFENWIHQGQVLIDDIIITDSTEDADALAKNYRDVRHVEIKKKAEIEQKKAEEAEEKKEEDSFTKDGDDDEDEGGHE